MAELSSNKQAFFDYEILEKFEAGLILYGFEVKSVKLGRASLRSSFIFFKNGEAYLNNANIPNYQALNTPKSYDPNRIRKILLNKKEIVELYNTTQEKGLTLIPLRLYTKGDKIKVEVALAKGKKKFDKRESIKKKDIKREIDRATKKRG
jgi:SsrA-binding protein